MDQASRPREDAAEAHATGGSFALAPHAGALLLTAGVAVAAKALGVVVAPGLHGIVSQKTVELFDTLAATLAYSSAALLVALVCAAAFELARARKVAVLARGGVVAISGLVVALASPAVVQRLHTVAALALAVVTSIVALVAGAVAVRAPHTRAIGAVLALLAVCALFRVVGWETAASSVDRGSALLFDVGRGFATVALVLQALTSLLAAAWLGTRTRWLGRILANGAIVVAFVITYVAARGADSPSTIEAMLRASLSEAAGVLVPASVRSIGAFLVPASILLALVAIVQKTQPPLIVGALALALLSHGQFDVPLQALLVTAASQWAMLATTSPEGQPGRADARPGASSGAARTAS